MTAHDEAVEAAARRQQGRDEEHWARTPASVREMWMRTERIGIEEYLRHMRAAGFVVTRVEGEIGQIHPQHIYAAGWNACRAATLANAVEVPE